MASLSVLFHRRRMLRPLLLWLALAVCCQASDTVHISASSNLFFALGEVNTAFKKLEPKIELKLTFDKSDKLVAQIYRGEACDVFVCADVDHPRDLIRTGHATTESLTVFATGRLVLWAANPELDLSNLSSFARNPRLRRLAITNAETGPYARAARQAMIRSGAWYDALAKITVADSILIVAKSVAAGEADAGFISLSLALSPEFKDVGHWREISVDPAMPLSQAAVLTKSGQKNRDARRYLAFLQSPEAQKILQACGYDAPVTAGRLQ